MKKVHRITGYARVRCPMMRKWIDPLLVQNCPRCDYCESITRKDWGVEVTCKYVGKPEVLEAPYKLECPMAKKWIEVFPKEKKEEHEISCSTCEYCSAIHYLRYNIEIDCNYEEGIERKIK